MNLIMAMGQVGNTSRVGLAGSDFLAFFLLIVGLALLSVGISLANRASLISKKLD